MAGMLLYEVNQNQLESQDHRNAEHEIPMPGFMPEYQHVDVDTNTASRDCDQKEGLFRNTPKMFSGFVLVKCDKHKAYYIY